MNDLQIFTNSEFGEIRVIEIDDKPYAVGVDVARALDYVKPSQAVIDHCKGIRKLGIPSYNQHGAEVVQETNVIPEGDIYRLIIKAADQSRNLDIKEKAARFESFVFDEVLPAIRKHGLYATESTIDKILADPDFGIRLLTQLKDEQAKNALLAARNEELVVELNESEKFWTIMKFNRHFNLRWDMKTCQRNGKAASAYSRQHGYEIKRCKTNDDRFEFTNSYAFEVLERLFLPQKSVSGSAA
jgi:prophage antirepressor-like protein